MLLVAAYNAYIDEAGDEGFVTMTTPGQGSSEWLVLGAIILKEEEDLALSHAVDDLRQLLNRPPPKPLHFRHLKHNARRAAMDKLATYDFVFSIVALWKPPGSGPGKQFPRAPYMYNWACRLLVERLTWYSNDRGRQVNLFFSNRATTSYAQLHTYMNWIQNDAACQIRRGCINRFQPVNQTVKLIQVADFYTSASFMALERDPFGNAEEDYLLRVKQQLYRRNGNLFSYGFKGWPPNGLDHQRYPWLATL
jgi:hypothetical protein